MEGGVNYVNVPNILLQDELKLRVYAYNRDYTKFEEDFKIIPRSKPAGYVYTPTEIKSFEALEARVETLETEGVPQETLNKGIEEYLKTHELPTGATQEQVQQIEANTAAITQAQSDIDALEAAANNYALKTEIPVVPTKVSAFENDKGYLTEHQDLSQYALKTEIPSVEGLATETYVDNAIANIEIGTSDNEIYIGTTEPTGSSTNCGLILMEVLQIMQLRLMQTTLSAQSLYLMLVILPQWRRQKLRDTRQRAKLML